MGYRGLRLALCDKWGDVTLNAEREETGDHYKS